MMKLTFTGLITAVLISAAAMVSAQAVKTVVPQDTRVLWMTDFAKAKTLAKELKRPILLDFTGSDWCKWCKLLDKEIFQTPEFQQWARKNVILVKIDFPRRAQQSRAETEQNKELSRRFKVEGFPTIVILNSDGEEIGRTGYKKVSPKAYIKHLTEYFK